MKRAVKLCVKSNSCDFDLVAQLARQYLIIQSPLFHCPLSPVPSRGSRSTTDTNDLRLRRPVGRGGWAGRRDLKLDGPI